MQFRIDHNLDSDESSASSSIPVPHVPPGVYLVTMKLDVHAEYVESGASQNLICQALLLGETSGGDAGLVGADFTQFYFARQVVVSAGTPLFTLSFTGESGIAMTMNATAHLCIEKISP